MKRILNSSQNGTLLRRRQCHGHHHRPVDWKSSIVEGNKYDIFIIRWRGGAVGDSLRVVSCWSSSYCQGAQLHHLTRKKEKIVHTILGRRLPLVVIPTLDTILRIMRRSFATSIELWIILSSLPNLRAWKATTTCTCIGGIVWSKRCPSKAKALYRGLD